MWPQMTRIAGIVPTGVPYAGYPTDSPLSQTTLITTATTTPADPMTVKMPYIKGIVKDAAGVLYIACSSCILALKPSPNAQQLYSFDTSQANTVAVPIYPDMSLPGIPTTSSGQSMAPSLSIYAGSPTVRDWPRNNSGADIRFRDLTGMAYSKQENCLYVTDCYSAFVLKISVGITPVTCTIVVGNPSGGGDGSRGTNDGVTPNNSVCFPKGIAVDNTGKYVYIADYGKAGEYKGGVRRYTVATGQLSTIVPYDQTLVHTPQGLVIDSSNAIYVSDSSDRSIFKLTPNTSDPPTYTSSLYAGHLGWFTQGIFDGPAVPTNEGRFNNLTGLAIDSKNNIYGFDEENVNSIRVITPGSTPSEGGRVYTFFGGYSGASSVDGDRNNAVLGGASSLQNTEIRYSGLYVDSHDLLYYSDQYFMGIKTLSYPYTNIVTQSYIDGLKASAARASSATAQTVSSALAQLISGAEASSATAQQTSSAVAQGVSSALAQGVSSALAQGVSSALAQSISGARESSATAQVASSAVAQGVSSALAQSISGARESSATAQDASSAVAQTVSSALAQSISGARESSATAQVASSALAQSISGAQASSATAQRASSSLAQSISGARASSAVAQGVSSAVAQKVSSAVAQTASSATQQEALVTPVANKDAIVADIQAAQQYINSQLLIVYSPSSSPSDVEAAKQAITASMGDLQNQWQLLSEASAAIFAIAPLYQDRVLQSVVPDPHLTSLGYIKLYDTMRNGYVVIDSHGYLMPNVDLPGNRLPPRQQGGAASAASGASGASGLYTTDILLTGDLTLPQNSAWNSYFDTVARRYFYVNSSTGVSQYDHPSPPAFSGSHALITDITVGFLPPGWVKLQSVTPAAPYYFNINTMQALWVHPNPPPNPSTLTPAQDTTLFPSYKKYIDPTTTKPFYVNVSTLEGQWNFPPSAFNTGPSSAASAAVASSAVAQTVSSALAQSISGARESSATAQVASSAVAQTVSSARQQFASSAEQQTASSAMYQTIIAATVSYQYILLTVYGPRTTPNDTVISGFFLNLTRVANAWNAGATAVAVDPITFAPVNDATGNPITYTNFFDNTLTQSTTILPSGRYPISILIDNTVPISFNAYYFGTGSVSGSDMIQWTLKGSKDARVFVMIDDKTAPQLSLVPDARNKFVPPIELGVGQNLAASSAFKQMASSATVSSATAQRASSSLMQSISGAQASSATAQVASSALAQKISGAEESSARAQDASSALAQAISGAQESSATAQTVSSALAQSISGAQESSATAQRASSSLMQSISGAQASSATAQRASSSLMQSISGAQESSARAQDASSALAQKISGAQESSARAQDASSALAQAISGAQESSATAQTVSSALAQSISGAQASSALAQAISGAQASSATAQGASSALAQAISGAQASSALAQSISGAQASSATAQDASSALAQSISGSRESSATAQVASSAVAQDVSSAIAQTVSSARQQSASSAQLEADYTTYIAQKDSIKSDLQGAQSYIIGQLSNIYRRNTSVTMAALSDLQTSIGDFINTKAQLAATGQNILKLHSYYQDVGLQTPVPSPTLTRQGLKKVYDTLRNTYVILDSRGNIVPNPETPKARKAASGAQQYGGAPKASRKVTRAS